MVDEDGDEELAAQMAAHVARHTADSQALLSLDSPICGVASVTRWVRWQGVRREGIPGVW